MYCFHQLLLANVIQGCDVNKNFTGTESYVLLTNKFSKTSDLMIVKSKKNSCQDKGRLQSIQLLVAGIT